MPLDVFVTAAESTDVCAEIVGIFRDFGSRQQRNKARLGFLIDEEAASVVPRRNWNDAGADHSPRADVDEPGRDHSDHLGIHPQAISARRRRHDSSRPARPGRPNHVGSDSQPSPIWPSVTARATSD